MQFWAYGFFFNYSRFGRSPLTTELLSKLSQQRSLVLNGIARIPKGLVASAIAQTQQHNLLVIAATLEEAGRWTAQLEAMGWQTVHFYPTSEASPYEPFDPEAEMTWGQLQVLADLQGMGNKASAKSSSLTPQTPLAIISTERALQPHLPPVETFQPYCLTLNRGMELNLEAFSQQLARLGYERVPLVETEGQWSRRGDIIDVFPVASELPVRLELFGDELDQIREFDAATQRSLDSITRLVLTTTDFGPMVLQGLGVEGWGLGNGKEPSSQTDPRLAHYLSVEELERLESGQTIEGMRRFLGLAFERPASLLDYLPENTLVAIDEPEQCRAHGDRWFEHAQEQWQETAVGANHEIPLPQIHRSFENSLAELEQFERLYLSELAEEGNGLNLASRPVPATPHQFAKLAETLRQERDRNFSIWLVSAQPSRSVALLQEHDCPAQFVPNPRDYLAIDKLQGQHIPVGVKYSGLAELEGFILPTFRLVVVTDREFFGQHSLATPSYVRKRRRAASKQVDPNKLQPGDYVVHKNHGVGKFLKLESLEINHETREYLVLQYADGLLRVAADQLSSLSRFRGAGDQVPQLNKMSNKAWEKTKSKVRKAVKKVAVDLLQLYAQRSQQEGHSYPPDMPWQEEMEDSFPYQPTTDQLKAVQDVKRDMESPRPMDRLVCGDVGFGKQKWQFG
ncbi:MAG: transcription-repair coupling factor, partial [Leptolyngbyaceae cyanobacterium SM1_4_3]|nr:transcription-repair coupling factor [Leptolyngbyaceae cyanobacterium SM1_4_3]